MKNKKILIISIVLMGLILILGLSYAIYVFTEFGSNQQLITGDIYMNYRESSALTMSSVYPSNTYDSNNYFEFYITGKNTNTLYDIYYDIILGRGDVPSGKSESNRIADRFIKFRLVERVNNADEVIFTDKSYDDLSSGIRVAVSTIPKNTTSEVTHTYRLYMWISNDVVIGNKNQDYTETEWNNLFASVKVSSTGGLDEKETYQTSSQNILTVANSIPNCTRTVTDTDGIVYISGNSDNSNIYSSATTDDCVIDFNYVWWSGKMWRITAVYPDGSMKMITDNSITTIHFNSSQQIYFYTKPDPGNSIVEAKSYAFQWLNEEFLYTLYNQGNNVIDTTKYWNETMPANTTISTKPADTAATMIPTTTSPVGLLNSYEYYKSYENTTYQNGYLNIGYQWWLLNPYNSNNVRYVSDTGFGNYKSLASAVGIRPSVYLKSGVTMIGSGSKDNPYRLLYDYSQANTYDNINTRHSGEYIRLSNNNSSQLFRIVDVENNKTKIVAIDYADNRAIKKYATSIETVNTLWGGGTTTGDNTWYTYLNNTYYPNLVSTYGELFDSNLYYLGQVADNYKLAVCANTTTGNTKVCTKTSDAGAFNIGLLRYGEMFAAPQDGGKISSISTYLMNRCTDTGNPDSASICDLRKEGYVGPTVTNQTRGAHPTVHLKSTVKVMGGSGTKFDPYLVGL